MTRPLQYMLCAILATAAVFRGASGACSSGVLQLQKFPDEESSDCFPGSMPSFNSIKALCTVASRVTVTSAGIIKMAPLVEATFNYSITGSFFPGVMNCKDLNASGLFNPGSSTSATVMLYDDLGGPLSNLTKTGPNQVTLAVAHTYSYQGPPVACSYNYTVVSGCVLGIKAPSKPLACPAGYIIKTGKFAIKYCSPCPAGTSSPGSPSTTCKPCPAGTYSHYAGRCKKCTTGYAPKAGSTKCEYCEYDGSGTTWTDGLRCHKCPQGSIANPLQSNQCQKCSAGKKCCTVNWTGPSGSCPKCSSGASLASYTSIFALHAASPSSCLASPYALCAPKINITVDASCQVTLSTLGYGEYVSTLTDDVRDCWWQTSVPILGAQLTPAVDLAQFPGWDANPTSLLAGNVTAVSPPYITFHTPSDKCTFKYRALTPAATLLGAPPKPCPLGTPGCPSKAAPHTCPGGQYLDSTSSATPRPCLRCPPGTYSPKANAAPACTPCPRGTYAPKYGSTACKACPGATVARKAGAASCRTCYANTLSYKASSSTCKHCPANTGFHWGDFGTCLAIEYGSVCCAAGPCTGQVRCSASLPRVASQDYSAVLQLVSKTLPQPACKSATFLACLQSGALLSWRAASTEYPLSVTVDPINQPRCAAVSDASIAPVPFRLTGGFATSMRAFVTSSYDDTVGFDIVSDKAKGTVVMRLANATTSVTTPALLHGCSATFKLIAGYAFDLAPPSGASCPSSAVRAVVKGRTFCTFCRENHYKSSKGTCEQCPAGTYQTLIGSTTCTTCPAGYACYNWSYGGPSPCPPGTYAPKASASECPLCPANTFSTNRNSTTCAPCPARTISKAGSTACGVPWDE